LEEARQRGNGWSRRFSDGWVAVNLNSRRRRQITYSVPPDLVGVAGVAAPREVTLLPHEGVLFRR
jgi:hypothetical protein